MTVAFAQEKPLSNLKYQYSSSYVKLVETHGDSSQISKKIIIPSTNSEWRIMEAKLLVSTPATKELESMIQLSVIFECEDKFNLSMWHISPKSFQQQIDLELEKRTYIDMMEYRFKSNPDDVLGFCKHNPQKLVQNMLEHLKDPYIQDTGSKRKHDDEEPQEGVEKKEEKIVKKKKVMTEPFVESHSDDEILEAAGKKQQNDSGEDEIYATEDAITMIKDVESDEQNEQLYAENSLPVEEDKSSGLANKSELSSDSSGLEGSTVAVESVVKESVMETIEKAVETDYSIEGIIEQSESSMEAIEEAMESCFETIEETSETVETKESNVEATIQENFLQEVKIVENTSKEPLQRLSPAAELLREIPSEKSSIQVVEEPANSIQDNPVEYLVDDLVEAMVDESAETVVENLFGSVEEKLASQGTEEATHLVEEPDQPPTEQPISLEDNTIANNEASLTEIKANFDETTGSEASISNHHLEENPDTVNNANEKTKELAEDYVFVDLEDIPENATGSFNDAQASNTIQQDYISQNVPLNEQDSNDEYAFASIPDKFERLDDSQADQESLLDAPNDEDLDQNFITDAANDEEPDEEPDKEGNDEEMDYGQDYGEDEVVYNPPNEQSNEAYVLLSSEEERGIQEVDESDTEAEENSEEQDTSMFDSIVGEKEENDLIEDEYEEEEPSSTIKDDLSDIGSIQQFFVPASNASYDDSTPKETSDKDTTQSAPSVDYIPVMEQDLFRLLREADIPAISNNTDITTNQNLDYANIYSSNITEDGGNKNNFYTFLPKQEPEQEPEMTKEDEELRKMQEKKLESENKFSALLEEIVGNKDIDSFMKQPLILEEQMDKLGSACWFSTDPRLKFLLIQYCDKHELGDQVVSLCRLLSNTSMFSSFFEEEESEFKRIYRKYLKDYTADSKGNTFESFYINSVLCLNQLFYTIVINVFTKEGRDRSLQDEANYSKSNTFTCYNNKDQKKIHHSYMQYYGFGFFKKF
jgi:hypothetical protein